MKRKRKPLVALNTSSVTHQCGIMPDTPETREEATRCLGWVFEDRIDDGVWNVRLPFVLEDDQNIDARLITEGGTVITLSLEWP